MQAAVQKWRVILHLSTQLSVYIQQALEAPCCFPTLCVNRPSNFYPKSCVESSGCKPPANFLIDPPGLN